MAKMVFNSFYEANCFAKKILSTSRVGLKMVRIENKFSVEGNFRLEDANNFEAPPKPQKIARPKATKNPKYKNVSTDYSHLTEEQKAAILEDRKNKERDKNIHLNKNQGEKQQLKTMPLNQSKRLCLDCGQSIPEARNDPRCVSCKGIWEKTHDTRTRINEGIAGTRDANKRMRAGLYGDIIKRSKG
ncbi:MAG TPA: hypothetical protein VIO87_01275 [Methylotenera sp.]